MQKLSKLTRALLALSCALLVAGLWRWEAGRTAPAAQPLPNLQGEAAREYLQQEGLYASLGEAVRAARYSVNPSAHTPLGAGAYAAPNPEQRLTAYFTPGEMRLAGRAGKGGWQFGMRLRGYGYGDQLLAVTPGALTAAGNRIEYARTSHQPNLQSADNPQSATSNGRNPQLTEWYVNRPDGLEQGFTLSAPPEGKAAGAWLSVALELTGDVEAQLSGTERALTLKAGGESLSYRGLKAWDATGRELESRLQLAGCEVRLEVDDAGAVYPVTIDPVFSQQAKLTASDAAANDQFGNAVAISGETVVIGAYTDGDGGDRSGSAYVFVRAGTVWSQQAKLTASDGAAGDNFGYAVAISGETIVVGALLDDDAGSDSGSAYVFVRDGTAWSQQVKLAASDAAGGDWFGWAVGISGEIIVVGAYGDDDAGSDSGSAYVFVREGTVWNQQAKLTASDAASGDQFGSSVAISGETIVVGAYLDDHLSGTDHGSAYVFVRAGIVWGEQQKLTASDATRGDWFGYAVAISGETIVVSAPLDDTSPRNNHGSAYVFVRGGTVWSQQQKFTASDVASFDEFGDTVAISGETIVVGSPLDDDAGVNSGSAYVFARAGTVWSQQQKLTASDAAAGDRFGWAVAISGETIVVGARSDDGVSGSDTGSAYVFALNRPPLITPQPITRQQGAAASTSQIATVNDADQPLDTLTVTVDGGSSATSNGVTISDITVDASGKVTGSVVADCSASDATFTLTVTDNQMDAANATLTVNVTANTPPALGNYPNATVAPGGSVTVTPASPPSDSVSISSVTITAPGFTGAATVNPTTGVVSISGAGPVGGFLVSVNVTDNCGAMTTRTFTLTVAADTCGITVNPATLPQPYVAMPYARILSATPAGNYTFSVSAGQLPPGLQLVTVLGVTSIAGLPTTPGVYNFTIKAKKNNSTCEASRSYTLTIPTTVVPILECVRRNQNGSYTARFGYDNLTGAAVTIPVGANNYFTPGNQNRGQTTVFQPGRVTNAFSVTFTKGRDNNLAIWLLRGPDGALRPVNALTTSLSCP